MTGVEPFRFARIIRENLRKLVPLALFYSWVEIFQRLLISPYSFIAETTSASIYSEKWLMFVSDQVNELSKIIIIIMAAYFLSQVLSSYLRLPSKERSQESWLTFFLTWIVYSSSHNFNNFYAQEPFWLALALIGVLFAFLANHIKLKSTPILMIVFTCLIFSVDSLGKFIGFHMSSSLELLIQLKTTSLLGEGPTQLFPIFFWSSIGILAQNLGLLVPFSLQAPAIDLTTTSENLNISLSNHLSKIPHLLSLYTIRDSFAMLGGLGLLLPLLLAVLFESKKIGKKYHYRLSLICLFPLLFDQNLPFLLGLPVIMEPILIIPMILVTIMAESFGALLLTYHWITPAVYAVPDGTPSLIFGFLASNGDWRYFIAVSLILMISIMIYLPFIKFAFDKEKLYD